MSKESDIVIDLDKEGITEETVLDELFLQLKDNVKKISTKNVIEIENKLLDNSAIEVVSQNIDAYIYDLENMFLNEFILELKYDRGVILRRYFKYENNRIFLVAEDIFPHTNEITFGGIAMVEYGKMNVIPTCSDKFYEIFSSYSKDVPISKASKKNTAYNFFIQALTIIILVNQIITKDKQFVVESTKAIELKSKSNKKKGKNQKTKKKTKLVRYFKIDSNKIKKAKEEEDRLKREYDRYTDEWSKIGHYRTYKSGKKVWIEPTTCKSSKKTGESLSKIYKIIK